MLLLKTLFGRLITESITVQSPIAVYIINNAHSFLNRGGIGATLGAIGAQLPYPYVHLVYWTIQVVLVALSIETGVILAADTYFKNNGEHGLFVFCHHCCRCCVSRDGAPPNYPTFLCHCPCIFTKFSLNIYFFSGQGDYSPVDDTPNVWPQDSNLWYFNKFMQITVRLNYFSFLYCESVHCFC